MDALASFLESLPPDSLDLEEFTDVPPVLKKSVHWKPDSEITQAVEFAINDTCLDLRRTIDATHGGLTSSVHHTDEEIRRFNETRKKERAMAGKGLTKDFEVAIDYDEIKVADGKFQIWKVAPRIYVQDPEAVYLERKLKSYERQNLADMHAGRKEIAYDDTDIPDSPSEPSTSSKFYTSVITSSATLDIYPSGVKEALERERVDNRTVGVNEVMSVSGRVPPIDQVDKGKQTAVILPSLVSMSGTTTFEDEFVRLNSAVQTAIMNSEELVKLFTQEPLLLRDMTVDKINLVLDNIANNKRRNAISKPVPISSVAHTSVSGIKHGTSYPPSGPTNHNTSSYANYNYAHPPSNVPVFPTPIYTQDKRSWGVSTIRSSVRNQVMNDVLRDHYGGAPRGSDPYMQRPPPPPPHALHGGFDGSPRSDNDSRRSDYDHRRIDNRRTDHMNNQFHHNMPPPERYMPPVPQHGHHRVSPPSYRHTQHDRPPVRSAPYPMDYPAGPVRPNQPRGRPPYPY